MLGRNRDRGEKRDLAGKIALVTGSGRGIGRATALALGRAGARVMISDVDGGVAEDAVRALKAEGIETRAHPLDVTESAQWAEVVAAIERDAGPIDILVNNAGIMTLGAFLEHGAAEDITQIEVNLLGVINGMRAVLPGMRQRRRGHVVNIASLAGKIGVAYAAIYAATKHAVVGLTESVRVELQGSGVEFSYVMPTLVNTELISGTGTPRWPPIAQPDDVAKGVLHALRHKAVEVYVPKGTWISDFLPAVLPRAVMERVGRALKVDTMFARIDREKRAAYVKRTSRPENDDLRDAPPSTAPAAQSAQPAQSEKPASPNAAAPRP